MANGWISTIDSYLTPSHKIFKKVEAPKFREIEYDACERRIEGEKGWIELKVFKVT